MPMRLGQMFTGVDKSPTEFYINGVRFRIVTATLGIAWLLFAPILFHMIGGWAAPMVLLGFIVLGFSGWYLDHLDPDKSLTEITQIRVLLHGMRNRYHWADEDEQED